MEKDFNSKINDYLDGKTLKSKESIEKEINSFIKIYNLTKDICYYDYLSSDIKLDYGFVQRIINDYHDDVCLLNKVAKYYIDNSKDEEKVIELTILMQELTKDSYYEKMSEHYYQNTKELIDNFRNDYTDKYEKYLLGMGYVIVAKKYLSNIIRSNYAKRFINDIINENNIDLECMLHAMFNNKEDIDETKRIEIILDLVKTYDSTLKDYLYLYPNAFSDLNNQIGEVIEQWNNHYIDNYEEEKFDFLSRRIWHYLEKLNPIKYDSKKYDFKRIINCDFEEEYLLVTIGKKLGLANKLVKYYTFDNCKEDEILDPSNPKTNWKDLHFRDERDYYLNVFEKMYIETIFSKEPLWEEFYEYEGITLKHNKHFNKGKK